MQKIILILIFFASTSTAIAQNKAHKIVYDLSSSDTALHSIVLRQFNNVLNAAPDTELELICHGHAIYMLVKNKAHLEDKMNELKRRGTVSFKVCANSMKRLNVDKDELISLAEIIPVAILELSEKQMQGWTYIKAGQ